MIEGKARGREGSGAEREMRKEERKSAWHCWQLNISDEVGLIYRRPSSCSLLAADVIYGLACILR